MIKLDSNKVGIVVKLWERLKVQQRPTKFLSPAAARRFLIFHFDPILTIVIFRKTRNPRSAVSRCFLIFASLSSSDASRFQSFSAHHHCDHFFLSLTCPLSIPSPSSLLPRRTPPPETTPSCPGVCVCGLGVCAR